MNKTEPFMLNLEHKKEKYIYYAKKSSRTIYWLVLLVMGIANFLIFVALIPFMLIINTNQLLVVIGAIGLLFGLIFNYLVKDIEHLQPKHHIFAAVLIPVLSIINIVILINIGVFMKGIYANADREILFSSAAYVVLFATPYLTSVILDRFKQ